jgi:LysM repeat protein
MNFYAEFLAAIDVYENHPQYFGPLVLDRPLGQAMAKPVVGQTRSTSVASPTAPAKISQTKTTSYTVRRGDTLAEIARRFGTSTRNLIAKNRLAGHTIYAGQILVVR